MYVFKKKGETTYDSIYLLRFFYRLGCSYDIQRINDLFQNFARNHVRCSFLFIKRQIRRASRHLPSNQKAHVRPALAKRQRAQTHSSTAANRRRRTVFVRISKELVVFVVKFLSLSLSLTLSLFLSISLSPYFHFFSCSLQQTFLSLTFDTQRNRNFIETPIYRTHDFSHRVRANSSYSQ